MPRKVRRKGSAKRYYPFSFGAWPCGGFCMAVGDLCRLKISMQGVHGGCEIRRWLRVDD